MGTKKVRCIDIRENIEEAVVSFVSFAKIFILSPLSCDGVGEKKEGPFVKINNLPAWTDMPENSSVCFLKSCYPLTKWTTVLLKRGWKVVEGMLESDVKILFCMIRIMHLLRLLSFVHPFSI